MYEDFVGSIESKIEKSNVAEHGAMHLLSMHREATSRVSPTILELGTATGVSTRMFLNAVHKCGGGHVVSVDIEDCSHVSESPQWTFVQANSADISAILASARILQDGIDILYIDSLHEAHHVRKELFGFFPYVKDGGVIFFDDLDSCPYMEGEQKDNINVEIRNRKILNLVSDIFMANRDKLYFSFARGETGLGRLQKCGKLGDELADVWFPRPRTKGFFMRMKRSMQKRLLKLGVTRQNGH